MIAVLCMDNKTEIVNEFHLNVYPSYNIVCQ